MRCSNCNKDWPVGLKFCAECGTELKASVPDGLSPAQSQVNAQLRTMLPHLGLGRFHEPQGDGVHVCQRGSTYVSVRVMDFCGEVAVRSEAPVTIGSRPEPDLMKFLLNKNAGLVFGAFGMDSKGTVGFSHTILASSMDAKELGASVRSVLLMADNLDDEIVKRWGGRTMRDTATKEIQADRMLQLLRSAQGKR